jgi:hypothetical protein
VYLLKEGRAAFLEFLRNLTPQILLLSLAFLVGSKLDFTRLDFSNTTPTVIFFIFVIIALMAGWANVTLLMDRFAPMIRFRRGVRLIDKAASHKFHAKLGFASRRRAAVIDGILLIGLVQFGVAATFLSAIATANKMVI